MILKENPRADLRWEKREDGKHVVTAGDEVLVETVVESLAKITYEEAVEERDPAVKARKAARAEWDIERARWDGFGERSTKNKGRGGRGGRGGV